MAVLDQVGKLPHRDLLENSMLKDALKNEVMPNCYHRIRVRITEATSFMALRGVSDRYCIETGAY